MPLLAVLLAAAPATPLAALTALTGTAAKRRLQVPSTPVDPIGSCWHYQPSGCPCNEGSNEGCIVGASSGSWTRDSWGESNGFAGLDGCATRQAQSNAWCGVDDIMMHYVMVSSKPACACVEPMCRARMHMHMYMCIIRERACIFSA